MSKLTQNIITFLPNIRWEKETATSGFTWGKPAKISNILDKLPANKKKDLGIKPNDVIAERWICTDDRANPSLVVTKTEPKPFSELLEKHTSEILGPSHTEVYGPYLNCIMKQLDTHPTKNRGALSVQLHPKPNHPSRPCKPEMWLGQGSVYLGWKIYTNPDQLEAAINDNKLEELMNVVDLSAKAVMVPGGCVHAIRADSFLCEWSKAPGEDDIQKGNIKDATIALYDRTDGKTPRPGKEDFNGAIELMAFDDSFKATNIAAAVSEPQRIETTKDYTLTQLFKTDHVWVFELELKGEYQLDLKTRGLPCYIESGQIKIQINNQPIQDKIWQSGTEFFAPFAAKKVKLINAKNGIPAKVRWWYTPLPSEMK